MPQAWHDETQGLVERFFYEKTGGTLNFGLKRVHAYHKENQKVKVNAHNLKLIKEFVKDFSFAHGKDVSRVPSMSMSQLMPMFYQLPFGGLVFEAILMYLLAFECTEQMATTPVWLYRRALALVCSI
jgi:hypothetical protein